MGERAPDMRDLMRLLDGGESDDILSLAAKKIAERLVERADCANQSGNMAEFYNLRVEHNNFKKVLAEILSRRHAGVLEQYYNSDEHAAYKSHDLLGP